MSGDCGLHRFSVLVETVVVKVGVVTACACIKFLYKFSENILCSSRLNFAKNVLQITLLLHYNTAISVVGGVVFRKLMYFVQLTVAPNSSLLPSFGSLFLI